MTNLEYRDLLIIIRAIGTAQIHTIGHKENFLKEEIYEKEIQDLKEVYDKILNIKSEIDIEASKLSDRYKKNQSIEVVDLTPQEVQDD